MTELGANVTRLVEQDREVYLIGTAHISRHSVEEVQRVIRELKPDRVCVELDATRYRQLVDERRHEGIEPSAVVRERRVGELFASLALSAFQRRLGLRLGIRPGAELLAGVDTAREVGAELILADRDIQITLKRCWGNLSRFDRLQLVLVLVFALLGQSELSEQQVEDLKKKETLRDAMTEFATHLPRLKTPLIDERDLYLVDAIARCGGSRVVAVVGAAHVPGMVAHWGKAVDRDELLALPPPPRAPFKLLVPVLFSLVSLLAIARLGLATLPVIWLPWFIAVAASTALSLLVARSRPMPWLGATLLAPITTLYPDNLTGAVAALAQLRSRPANTPDKVAAVDSMLTVGAMRKNPFTHALALYLLAQLGSYVGATIALVWMLVRLFTY